MKRFIYPAVLYTDAPEAGYIIVVKDLGLVMEGETPEEAFSQMKDYMEKYFELALAIENDIPDATRYQVVAKAKSKNTVIMIDVKVEGKKVL